MAIWPSLCIGRKLEYLVQIRPDLTTFCGNIFFFKVVGTALKRNSKDSNVHFCGISTQYLLLVI